MWWGTKYTITGETNESDTVIVTLGNGINITLWLGTKGWNILPDNTQKEDTNGHQYNTNHTH
jgi:hypothetical protein